MTGNQPKFKPLTVANERFPAWRPHAPLSQSPGRRQRDDVGLRELLGRRLPKGQTAARAILCLLHSYANADGVAWPSQATLAAAAGVSVRTCERAIATLHLARVIDVWRRHPARSGNAYRVLYPLRPARETPTPKPAVKPAATKPSRTRQRKMAPWPSRPIEQWPPDWFDRLLRRGHRVYGWNRFQRLDLFLTDQIVRERYFDVRADEHARLCYRILDRHGRGQERLPRAGPDYQTAMQRMRAIDQRHELEQIGATA